MNFLHELFAKVDYKLITKVIVGIIVDIIVILLCGGNWHALEPLRIVINSILSALLSGMIAFLVWEIIAKRTFAEEVLGIANISENLRNSGIIYYYDSFLKIDWRKIISEAHTISMFITYGRTWRENNRDVLEDFFQKGGKMKVYLPDNTKDSLMTYYDERFQFQQGKTKEYVNEAIEYYLGKGAEVKLYNGMLFSTYYVIDEICLLAVFNHRKDKSTVPAIKATKKGFLGSFIEKEFEAIDAQSSTYVSEEKNDKPNV